MKNKQLFNMLKINPSAKKALIESYNSRGFFKSFEIKQPVKFDQPYPLLTNPFIDWITSWDLSKSTYLEIGSGASTIYFQKYFQSITSIEPNIQFYNDLKPKLNKNVNYKNISKSTLEDGYFNVNDYYDFCLIDYNLHRHSLVSELLKKSKFAYLIFDTTEQYPNTCELIKDNGYTTQIDFWGFKNTHSWETCTSVFINDDIKVRLNKVNRYPAPMALKLYHNIEQDYEKIPTK
jgi:hypothetical protein